MTRLTPIAGDEQRQPGAAAEHHYALSAASIAGFHDKLRLTLWQQGEGDTPLAKCLCTMLLALDPSMEIARVIESLPRRAAKIDMVDIVNALANMGYDSKSTRLRPVDIDPRLLPCLFVTHDSKGDPADVFVILEKRDLLAEEHLEVFDGRQGVIRQLADDDPLLLTSGTAHFCQRFSIEELALPKSTNPRFIEPTWFRRTLARFAPTFWWLLVIGIVLNLVALATPITVMLIYDRVISSHTLEPLPMLLVGLVCAIFLEWRLRSLRTDALAWLTARLDYVVGASIFERLLLLAPSFVERAAVAAQIARIKTFESVRDFFSGPVFLAVLELPTILIAAAGDFLSGRHLGFRPDRLRRRLRDPVRGRASFRQNRDPRCGQAQLRHAAVRHRDVREGRRDPCARLADRLDAEIPATVRPRECLARPSVLSGLDRRVARARPICMCRRGDAGDRRANDLDRIDHGRRPGRQHDPGVAGAAAVLQPVPDDPALRAGSQQRGPDQRAHGSRAGGAQRDRLGSVDAGRRCVVVPQRLHALWT